MLFKFNVTIKVDSEKLPDFGLMLGPKFKAEDHLRKLLSHIEDPAIHSITVTNIEEPTSNYILNIHK